MDFIEGKLIYSFFSTFNMIFVFTISGKRIKWLILPLHESETD